MPKFKVGDHVVSHCDSYGITKTGWTGVVTGFYIGDEDMMRVRGDNSVGGFTVFDTVFDVSIDDFDLVCNHNKIVITTDGKTTTATHYDGKRVIRKETARCNPDDEFNFLTGAAIAFDRLTGRTVFDVSIDDFDLVCNHNKIVITTDGKTTTATHYDGKRVIRKETARCNPDDEFNFLTGAAIAFDRLTGRDEMKKRDLREFLTPGVFGKSNKYGAFVIIGAIMTFKNGGWMSVTDYSTDNLESRLGDKIEYLVKPSIPSFNIADIEFRDDKNVVWKRK